MYHKNTRTALVSCLLIAASVGFLLWRAQFGLDLYDEPFYLVSGFKLFALGDQPFLHEVHNGPRQYDLLNHLLVRPWVPFSVLFLRRLAIVCYASCLLLFITVCFRRKFNVWACTVFAACLWFDLFLMPTWSHNWWVRNLILLHHSTWILSEREKPWLATVAGICLGISVVAYHTLLPVALLALGLSWTFSDGRKKSLWYLSGFAFVLATDAFYLFQPSVWSAWKSAVDTVRLDYTGKITLEKPWNIIRYVLSLREFWVLLSCAVLAPRLGNRWLRFLAFGGAGFYFLRKFSVVGDISFVLNSFVALGFSALIYNLFSGVRNLSFLGVMAALIGFTIACSSANGRLALFWMVPLLLVPFCAQAKPWQPVLLATLLFVTTGAFLHQKNSAYFDVPMKEASSRLEMEPLRGIYTSPGRATLLSELYQLSHKETYALSLGIPAVFYFGSVRSATNTTVSDPNFNPIIGGQGLELMVQEKRYPGLLVLANISPYLWGGAIKPFWSGLSDLPISLSASPYHKILECAARGEQTTRAEYLALRINPSSLTACLKTSQVPALAVPPHKTPRL